jgi:hypothetical protein
MSDANAGTRVAIFVDESLADEVVQGLDREGASDVERHTHEGDQTRILPFIPIVIGATIGVHALAALIISWRDHHQCRTLIDARKDDLEQIIDCRIKDGRIIVVANDGTQVQIIDAPNAFDLTEVLKAGVSSTGDAVKAAAEAAGATVRGPEPAPADPAAS